MTEDSNSNSALQFIQTRAIWLIFANLKNTLQYIFLENIDYQLDNIHPIFSCDSLV